MKKFDITILGEVNLDLILYGLPTVLPTERELLGDDFHMTLGGSSSILAHNLAVLGSRVGFVTKTGDDSLGKIALERLTAAGVDLSRAVHSHDGIKTGVTIVLPHGRERHILTYPGTMATLTMDEVDQDYLADAKHFHVSSLFLQQGIQATLPGLCRNLRSKGLTTSLDTNDDPSGNWGGPLQEMLDVIDILLPNDSEARSIAGCDDLSQAISVLAGRVPIVAVKCGSEGCIVQEGKQRWRIPALSVSPVDTVGAGDSFNAGFLSAYVKGRSLAECGEAGNAAAALSTLRPGGTEAFLEHELRSSFLESQR